MSAESDAVCRCADDSVAGTGTASINAISVGTRPGPSYSNLALTIHAISSAVGGAISADACRVVSSAGLRGAKYSIGIVAGSSVISTYGSAAGEGVSRCAVDAVARRPRVAIDASPDKPRGYICTAVYIALYAVLQPYTPHSDPIGVDTKSSAVQGYRELACNIMSCDEAPTTRI
jgi:hypothetical protein